MLPNRLIPCVCAYVALGCLMSAAAPIDGTFNYQARLTSGGVPITGVVDARFSLWDAAAAGSQIGVNIEFLGEAVSDGLYNADLDFGVAALNGDMRWLQVEVRSPAGVGGYVVLGRREILGAPYSIQTRGIFVDENSKVGIGTTNPEANVHIAGGVAALRLDGDAADSFSEFKDTSQEQLRINKTNNAGHVLLDINPKADDGTSLALIRFFRETNTTGLKAVQFLRGNFTTEVSARIGVDGEDSYFGLHGGNVGIGTSTPIYPLHVESDGTRSIYAKDDASTGQTFGGYFQSESTSGRGVFGLANAGAGITDGVFGQSNSTSGRGICGWAPASTGTTYGVYGTSDSTSGAGVSGEARAASGFTSGVSGTSDSTSGRGVYGLATAGTGTTRGVFGQSESTNGRGVFGLADATSGINYGGRFESDSTGGNGVFGFATASTGTNRGVSGHTNSPSGFAFLASGPGTDYGSISSRRWKHNIEPISDPLRKLARLRGVYFDWDEEHGGLHDVGMIAEEVGEVLPEIVNYEENGIDAIGMDYSKMTPLLVEAVNALRAEKDAENDALRAENEMLRARLESIENRLDAMASPESKSLTSNIGNAR